MTSSTRQGKSSFAKQLLSVCLASALGTIIFFILLETAAIIITHTSWGKRHFPLATGTGTTQTKMVMLFHGLPTVPHEGYYLHKPGVYKRTQGDYRYTIEVNQHGFRGREFDRKPRNDLTRIVCLGGSSTLCIECDEESTYPRLVEKKLQAAAPNLQVEVINAGLANAGLAQVEAVLTAEILPLQPALILINSGVNNIKLEDDRQAQSWSSFKVWGGSVANWLYRQFHFARLTKEILYQKANRSSQRAFGIQQLADYQQRMLRIIDAAHRAAVSVVLVKQPIFLPQLPIPQDTVAMRRIEQAKHDGSATQDELRWWFQSRIHGINAAIAGQEQTPLVDAISAIYDGGEANFFNFCHLTPQGNEILAKQASAVILAAQGWSGPQ